MYKFVKNCKYCKNILNINHIYTYIMQIYISRWRLFSVNLMWVMKGDSESKPEATSENFEDAPSKIYASRIQFFATIRILPLSTASRMTKFAIEKYVSKHRTRELGPFKRDFFTQPREPTPMLDSLFKLRGRSSHPAGSFSFARDFGTRSNTDLYGRSVKVSTCLVCQHVKKLGQSCWILCAGSILQDPVSCKRFEFT